MRRRTVIAAGLSMFVTAASSISRASGAAPKTSKSAVHWKADLKAAQKAAEETGRPMLIVFGAEWCAHCGRFEKSTLGDPQMAGLINREFVPVRLDFDEEQKIAEVMEVEALPCTVILSPEADLLGRVVGAKQPKDFSKALQHAQTEHLRIRHARIASARDGDRK